MDALIEHRKKGLVHYTQDARRMTIVRNHLLPPFGSKVIYEDCSSAVTGLYRMAGLHDPNELKFSGFGYTGTLVQHGRKLRSWEKPQVGDLVFYGGVDVPHHVTCVYGVGKQGGVVVWSHGHEGGPLIALMDYRPDRTSIRRYIKRREP